MTKMLLTAAVIALTACSSNPPPSAAAACAGTRVLTVNNGSDEAMVVYAVNGRTTTEIGTVPQGKKDLTIAPDVRATSFYAVAASRSSIAGSGASSTADSRVTFVENCRPK